MADLPVAPDWTTWAQGGYLPPDGSSLGVAAVGPGGGYVPPGAMPNASQAAQSGGILRSLGHAILPALVDAPKAPPPAPPVAPPAAPVPPAPPPPQAPHQAAAQPPLPTPPIPPSPAPAPPQQAPQRPLSAPPQTAPQAASQTQTVDPFAAMEQPSQGSKQGNYYASAVPPQGPLADVVQQAAQKYGVPLPVATWVGFHESGWNPNATGIQTSSGRAQGMWQFMPGTAQQYGLQNPNDPVASTDAAMHKLSDLAKANGGDWEKAVAQYGTFSTGQGQAQDQAARNGFRQWMGMAPEQGQSGPSLMATQTQDMSPGSPAAVGNAVRSINLPYSTEQTTVPQGYKLLALASGILSGKNLGEGLGKGLAAMAQFEQQDVANKRAANAQAIQMGQMDALNKYRAQLAATSLGRLQNSQANTAIHGQSVANSYQLGQERAQQGAARTGGYLQGIENRYNPNLQAQIAGAKTGANTEMKENANDIDTLYNDAAEAQAREPQIAAMRQLVGSGQVATGPGVNALKRQLSNYFNVDLGSDPTQTQMTAAMASQLRGTQAFAKNMRNVREFNSIMEGLPNVDLQNPQAMGRIINGLDNLNQLKLQLGTAWRQLPPAQQGSMRANQDAYQNWFQDQVANWRKGLDQRGGFYGDQNASAPTQQQAAAPAPTSNKIGGTTSSGVSWSLQ